MTPTSPVRPEVKPSRAPFFSVFDPRIPPEPCPSLGLIREGLRRELERREKLAKPKKRGKP
jgi:hypothetical protein